MSEWDYTKTEPFTFERATAVARSLATCDGYQTVLGRRERCNGPRRYVVFIAGGGSKYMCADCAGIEYQKHARLGTGGVRDGWA